MTTHSIEEEDKAAREWLDRWTDKLLAGDHTAHYVRREKGMIFIDVFPVVKRRRKEVVKGNKKP